MGVRDIFKSWSEQKKKNFSIILAGIITVLIVITWFSFNPLFGPVDIGNNTQTVNTDYLNDTLNKITEQYNIVVDQISNSISSTSAIINATSSTSGSVESSSSTQQ